MADLKNIVMGVLTILFIATASVTVFSFALTNNISNGGSGSTVSFPLINQTAAYSAEMTNYSAQLSNSTAELAIKPDAANAFSGLVATTQAATSAVSLSFSSMSMLLTMIASVGVSLVPLGVPSAVVAFGALMITVTVAFAILAAVFKWPI